MNDTVTLRAQQQSATALSLLAQQGLTRVEKPEGDMPSLPSSLPDLGDEELMELFTGLTGWHDYVAYQVAMAAIDERSAQKKLDYAEASALIGGWGGGSDARVSVAKAKVRTDPKVMQMTEELDALHAYRKLVEVMATNLERDAALVSRELTRRTSDNTRNRSNKWQL